jgi:hypothetical protein
MNKLHNFNEHWSEDKDMDNILDDMLIKKNYNPYKLIYDEAEKDNNGKLTTKGKVKLVTLMIQHFDDLPEEYSDELLFMLGSIMHKKDIPDGHLERVFADIIKYFDNKK